MTRQLSLSDHTALTYLSGGHATATRHIARACGLDRTHFHPTAAARTMLKRLERSGLVEGISAPGGGNIYWWKITNAGRKAVQP